MDARADKTHSVDSCFTDKRGRKYKLKTANCTMCGALFTGIGCQKYCSAGCCDEAQREAVVGDKWIIFNRDGCRCVYCGTTSSDEKLVPDHVVPIGKGGDDTAANIVTACAKCNAAKRDQSLSPESMSYILHIVSKRNDAQGIPPRKTIKGSHTTEKRNRRTSN